MREGALGARPRRAAAFVSLLLCGAGTAQALVIDHNLAFGAFGQSPFRPGGVFEKSASEFVGPKWSDAPLSLVLPPGCPLELCLRPNLKTSGAFGAELGYALSGGKLDFGYPVSARVSLPDAVVQGGRFTVTIDSAVNSAGFGFERATLDANPVLAPWAPIIKPGGSGARHAAFMNATFPSFAAWLDLVARFSGSIQLRGTAPIAGTGTIFESRLPGFDERLTVFRMDKSGISTDIAIPGGARTIPFGTAIQVIPGSDILTATLQYPDLKPTGVLDGSVLRASDAKTVADLRLSVLELLGLGFPILRLLKDDIDLGIGKINYTLLEVIAGLSADLRQNLTLSAVLKPTLTFDTPVTVIDASGSRSVARNTVELPASGSVQLELANRGSSKLEGQLGYKLVATLHNDTDLALNGRLKASALAAGIDVDIGIKIKESVGPVIGPIGPEGPLFEFDVFEESFAFGLNDILTRPFSIDVAIPTRSLVHTRVGGIGALATYRFRERCGELFCSPEVVEVLGLERSDAYGGSVFESFDEIVFTSGGTRSYGTLYCLSCVDADFNALPRSSDFVIDTGASAYINDYLLPPPTGPDCLSCLEEFLLAHTGLSRHQETPLEITLDRTRAFYFGGASVASGGTSSLLLIGLMALAAARLHRAGREPARLPRCC